MRKLLLATVAVLALAGTAHAGNDDAYTAWLKRMTPNAQALKGQTHDDDHIACGACSVKHPAVLIGWMKSSDIGCSMIEDKQFCNALDHYTDAYQRGEMCATYGVPFYDLPNGKPMGLVWGENQILLGAKSKDGKWVHVWSSPTDEGGTWAYSLKSLRGCG
jgi:hypothetical protein